MGVSGGSRGGRRGERGLNVLDTPGDPWKTPERPPSPPPGDPQVREEGVQLKVKVKGRGGEGSKKGEGVKGGFTRERGVWNEVEREEVPP